MVKYSHCSYLSHLKNEWMAAKLGSGLVCLHSQGAGFSRKRPASQADAQLALGLQVSGQAGTGQKKLPT